MRAQRNMVGMEQQLDPCCVLPLRQATCGCRGLAYRKSASSCFSLGSICLTLALYWGSLAMGFRSK